MSTQRDIEFRLGFSARLEPALRVPRPAPMNRTTQERVDLRSTVPVPPRLTGGVPAPPLARQSRAIHDWRPRVASRGSSFDGSRSTRRCLPPQEPVPGIANSGARRSRPDTHKVRREPQVPPHLGDVAIIRIVGPGAHGRRNKDRPRGSPAGDRVTSRPPQPPLIHPGQRRHPEPAVLR